MAWYRWDGVGPAWYGCVWLGIVWNRMAWYGLVCTGMERHGTAHTRRVTGLSVSAARGEVVVVETGESTGVLEEQRRGGTW
jgi:hypothetical protein